MDEVRCDKPELEMIKALGLPETTYSLHMTFDVGEVNKGTCKFYITGEMMNRLMDSSEEVTKRLPRRMDTR